jgi:hypothetical protein
MLHPAVRKDIHDYARSCERILGLLEEKDAPLRDHERLLVASYASRIQSRCLIRPSLTKVTSDEETGLPSLWRVRFD